MSLDDALRHQVSAIIDTLEHTDITELNVEHGSFALHIERSVGTVRNDSVSHAPSPIEPDSAHLVHSTLRSPQVGTFYLSAEPDGEPFLAVGSSVEQGQVIGLIEAMKLVSEIEAELSGVIRRILVSDGQPVEFGQALFELE